MADKGWVQAGQLVAGDVLVGHENTEAVVEAVVLTERTATVYNLRVAEDHTYFVGGDDWGFSVWVHNTYSVRRAVDGTFEVIDAAGTVVRPRLLKQGVAEDVAKAINIPPVAIATVNTSTAQLQKKFKHAIQFGVTGTPQKATLQAFDNAIQQHVQNPAVQHIIGTYRQLPAILHTDANKLLVVVTDLSGNFISGWKLSAQQLWHALNEGKLGGG